MGALADEQVSINGNKNLRTSSVGNKSLIRNIHHAKIVPNTKGKMWITVSMQQKKDTVEAQCFTVALINPCIVSGEIHQFVRPTMRQYFQRINHSCSRLLRVNIISRLHNTKNEAHATEKCATLIKNKIKFSSYLGKFRVEQLQSHI